MSQELLIQVRNLSKVYKLYNNPVDRLKESLHPLRKKYHRDFFALRDISFDVRKGESVGIIGENGSGKSTLLKILTGVLTPSSGSMTVNGKIAALLELGTGFNPELTGIENIFFSGTIMGYTKKEMDDKIDAILAFADIGEFVHQPVKTYSSGMFVRLAFASAISVDPDILIVDEALSVGDIFFQQKCHARMEELVKQGTTILVVSHNMEAIEKYCGRVLLLNNGQAVFMGPPIETVHRYYALKQDTAKTSWTAAESTTKERQDQVAQNPQEMILDWPTEKASLDLSNAIIIGDSAVARCSYVAVCNSRGEPCETFRIGDTAYFYSEFEFLKDEEVPLGGISIINNLNIIIHAKGSFHYLLKAPHCVRKGNRIRFRQSIKLQIAVGEYTFVVSLASMNAADYLRLGNMRAAELGSKLNGILRVSRIGRFFVLERSQGLGLPFYGNVDLEGDMKCELLQ